MLSSTALDVDDLHRVPVAVREGDGHRVGRAPVPRDAAVDGDLRRRRRSSPGR